MTLASSLKSRNSQARHRIAAIGVAGLAVGGVLLLTIIFLWPQRPDGFAGVVQAGHIDDFQVEQPVYFAKGDFWLVKLSESEVIALKPLNPGFSRTYEENCYPEEIRYGYRFSPRLKPHNVNWRTDEWAGGRYGTFWALCSLSRFDITGAPLFGPTPRSLDRYPVKISGGVMPQESKVIEGKPRPR